MAFKRLKQEREKQVFVYWVSALGWNKRGEIIQYWTVNISQDKEYKNIFQQYPCYDMK